MGFGSQRTSRWRRAPWTPPDLAVGVVARARDLARLLAATCGSVDRTRLLDAAGLDGTRATHSTHSYGRDQVSTEMSHFGAGVMLPSPRIPFLGPGSLATTAMAEPWSPAFPKRPRPSPPLPTCCPGSAERVQALWPCWPLFANASTISPSVNGSGRQTPAQARFVGSMRTRRDEPRKPGLMRDGRLRNNARARLTGTGPHPS